MCHRFVTMRRVSYVLKQKLALSSSTNTVKGNEMSPKSFGQTYEILIFNILPHLTLLFWWTTQK